MLTRTPYDASGRTERLASPHMKDLLSAGDDVFVEGGYIRVFQDVRGKYGSEGDYVMTRPLRGPLNPSKVDHATDAWDTIDWLVKNVKESNGKVGMIGSSYEGFTVVMALTNPHPALKVAVPESPMVDGWMGDDWFNDGAFRQVNFDYFTAQLSKRGKGAGIPRQGQDDYSNFLQAGSAGDFAKAAGLEQLPWWHKLTEHAAYDAFWQEQALDKVMARTPLKVPTMWLQGLWDQEDMWGAIHSYAAMEPRDKSNTLNYLVMGPWRHSQVNYDGSALGALSFEGDTARQFRHDVLRPFFDQYLVDGAPKANTPPVFIYNTGENHWDRLKAWPRSCDKGCASTSKPLYLQAGGKLSFQQPVAGQAGFEEYVSDPAKPVPFVPRPVDFYRPRDVDHLAGARPALCRWPSGCVDLRHRAPDRGTADRRCPRSTSASLHQRQRQRLGGEADRRVSGRDGVEPEDGRLRVAGVAGDLPRPLPREFQHAQAIGIQSAAGIPVRPANRQPHLPAGPPGDGAGAVQSVPALRSQPADLRA